MASSLEPKRIYDVFLSFRGADLHNNFIAHLYQALHRDGVYTFRDSEELKKGDQILLVLMKAIEESCIAIIVFSEDYASSRWCLEELAKIIECKEQKNLIVLPVFYKADPREVREGRKSYQRSLGKHEFKFGKDSEKVKRWKKALFDAGNLSGWHLNDGDESELIQEIVNKISTYLDRPLHVAKHPIGIYSRVTELKSMLKLESNDGVLMVGLWGQGGIGKTCLAKALYNALFRKFEGACFLANVRETSKDSRGLVTLQEMIINDILLPQQRLKVSNVDEGNNLIQRRLGRKKVLLILDDADALCHLDALAGKGEWFGNGSRIIVTTRDKQLLTCHRIDQDHVYKVEPLSNSQAHELLSKHAFQTHQIKTDLVDGALEYAKGLPLALEVLGSLLCGTTEDVWESTIKKLSRNPDKNINNVLKVSFDGLDENEKDIFLHIACFFKGWARECTKKILDSCDLETIVGFDVLIKRSLISFEHGIIRMHDLIQAMGMDIVNQGCRDDPARRNRLWLYDDVIDVLSCDMVLDFLLFYQTRIV
ncbi:disease resistance protein RUN1-like [Eucalyptus grandis]|uniref:disease resistance protein RUN1-like n=1 Tax=Eucalyptus grandis TaxID=71139 RepID=UPI00192EAC4B|nr:disease resistance protein RUN1-like [Eucalyptus grandis]